MPHPPKGVLGVTPGIIGCAEAAEVLKIIGEYGKVLSGKLWTINIKTMETHLISF
jgi:adenylyltransferase/sulfurtransferase